MTLNSYAKKLLVKIAGKSIRHGFLYRKPLPLNIRFLPEPLQQPGAAFVTLANKGKLRGCIGSLEPQRPLAEDVANNAFAAAFHDSRFPALQHKDYRHIDIHVSVLSPLEAIEYDSKDDLITKLRPGIDGLVLQQGNRKGTFLPSVWEELPEPNQFLDRLKTKAGLNEEGWSNSLKMYRYTVEAI